MTEVLLSDTDGEWNGKFRNCPAGDSRTICLSKFSNSISGSWESFFGTLFHRWFELVQWVDDGLPKHGVLRSAAESLALGNLDLESELRTFENSVNSGNLRINLSRAVYQNLANIGLKISQPAQLDLKIYTEYPFVVQEPEFFSSGVIDRLDALVKARKDRSAA